MRTGTAVPARRGARLGALIAAGALALAAGPFLPLSSPLGAAPARAAECNGDECQSVPPPPDDPTPGTASAEGPQDAPAHFAKHHKKKRHKHHPKKHHRHRGKR